MEITEGAEAMEVVRDGAVESSVVDVYIMVKTNERGSVG